MADGATEQPARTVAALSASGWEQGSMFLPEVVIPSLAWAHPRTQLVRQARTTVEHERRKHSSSGLTSFTRDPGQHERVLVMSHSCDIIKPSEELPIIEVARAFRTTNARVVAESHQFGNARYFALRAEPPSAWLILDYGWRALLDKGFLLEHAPDNSLRDSWGLPERTRLGRWLARRHDRPALSDDDTRRVAQPVRRWLAHLAGADPATGRRFLELYTELRFRWAQDGALQLTFISAERTPDVLLVAEVLGSLIPELEMSGTRVQAEATSYFELTMASYLESDQIDIEWMTVDDNGEGAETHDSEAGRDYEADPSKVPT